MASTSRKRTNPRASGSTRRSGLNKKVRAVSLRSREAAKKRKHGNDKTEVAQSQAQKDFEKFVKESDERFERNMKRLDEIGESMKEGIRAIMGKDYVFTKL